MLTFSSRCLHVYVQFLVNLVLINRLLVNTTADTQKDTAWHTMYLAGQLACLPACHVHILVVQYLPFSEWRWTHCIWCYLVSVRLVFARKRVVHFFIIPFYMPGQQEVLWLCVCVCVSVCFLIETPYSFIHLFFFEPNYLPCLALPGFIEISFALSVSHCWVVVVFDPVPAAPPAVLGWLAFMTTVKCDCT